MAKTVTVEKLQAFIEAVEFAADLENPEEWVPTERQWRKIRSMIDNLEAAPPAPAPPPLRYEQPQAFYSQQPQAPVQFAGPSSLDNVQYAPAQTLRGVPMATGENTLANPVATPNLDTSDGNYNSSFA